MSCFGAEDFKSLTISELDSLSHFIDRFPPYSDFNLISLYTYNVNEDSEFAWLNDNLVIKLRDYVTGDTIVTFLGTSKIEDTITALFQYQENTNLPPKLELIPEVSIESLLSKPNALFTISENLAQNDYIIPLKESAELANINEHKQMKYHHFINTYPGFEFKELDISIKKTQEDLLGLFDHWVSQRKNKDHSPDIERQALGRIFKHSSFFSTLSHGLYIGKNLVGFIIDEPLKTTYIMGHFIKANFQYGGVYEVMNQLTAKLHYERGYKFINIEQDLGIPGLRTSKLQRSPAFFLKKYSVSKPN